MNGFLKWFFVFMSSMLAGFGQIFKGLWNGIKQIFNIKNYIRIFKTYSADFGALGWILSVLAIIVVVAIFVLIIFMIVLAVRKYIRFRHSIVSNEDLIEEISDLQRQVVKMTKEKDEIMAMKVAQLGVYDNTALAEGETKLAEGEQMPAQGEVKPLWTALFRQQIAVFQSLSRWTISTRHTSLLLTIMTSPLVVSAKHTETLPAQECTFIMT